MMSKSERLKRLFPVHWYVWHNDSRSLQKELQLNRSQIERRDPRGRTALMLAVALGHLESADVLLQYNAQVGVEDSDGFTVLHEAVSTGDPELVQRILESRDQQRNSSRVGGIPDLLGRIRETPDFYMEMKWEFTSWVPLVSRMCPSDTYKVYKSGSCVRIDTTLLGFEQSDWQRGSRSYIFKGNEDSATMMEVDHEAGQVYVEQMRVASRDALEHVGGSPRPSAEAVAARLTSPIVTTFVDTEKISFERNKSGIWGWRSEKTEMVNGHECKVFAANNVELVTKTRTEHLTETDKQRHKGSSRTPFQSLLGIVETEDRNPVLINGEEKVSLSNPCRISIEEYLDESVSLNGRDIGRPREVCTKLQKFKATLWLCEEYPLSLQEQILPIVDLMAISSTHFAKLRDFITLQLPSGFPVKIEIPLFHVLNARITFGNIFGMDEAVAGVTHVDTTSCVLDDACFEPPPGYVRLGSNEFRQLSIDEDDQLLQFAIQQSLLEAGSEQDQVTIWEALRAERPGCDLPQPEDEDCAIQRAIQESLALKHHVPTDSVGREESPSQDDLQEQLEMAMRLSQREKEEDDLKAQQLELEEAALLQRILQLSVTDK